MQSPLAHLPAVVKNLLIINVICFIPFLLFNPAMADQVYNLASAHYFDSPLFKPWQPITYMFFHGGWMHIIFNMFALYSLGAILEYTMGPKRFLLFYFICGLGGIGLQLLVQAIEVHAITGSFTIGSPDLEASFLAYGSKAQELYNIYHSSMVGASGAIFGLFIAFGMMFPNTELMIMFIPVPVKAKYVMAVYVLVELSLSVSQVQGDDVAHFAHLGGALIGFILVKAWHLKGPKDFQY
jgi:membrane associated rhomboid family serine protease